MRIRRKCRPGMLHRFLKLSLRLGFRKLCHQLGIAEDHIHVDAVIRTAGGIEPGIIPVSKVAESPGWDSGGDPVGGFLVGGTGEGLFIELSPIHLADIGPMRVRRDFIISRFIVIVS